MAVCGTSTADSHRSAPFYSVAICLCEAVAWAGLRHGWLSRRTGVDNHYAASWRLLHAAASGQLAHFSILEMNGAFEMFLAKRLVFLRRKERGA